MPETLEKKGLIGIVEETEFTTDLARLADSEFKMNTHRFTKNLKFAL